ncbi:MAG: T9SS type A sorting domain-containing protein [Edaphocola sp.]
MNNILLISTIVLLGSTAAMAQTFAPMGATWWLEKDSYPTETPSYDGFDKALVTDTVSIDGITSSQVVTYQYRVYQGSPQLYTITKDTLYFASTQDTVWLYNENFNRFTPLYVFNVQEGDTVSIPVPHYKYGADLRTNPISGDTSFSFVVDSVRNVSYGGVTLKTIYNHILYHYDYDAGQFTFPALGWGVSYSGNLEENPLAWGAYAEKIGSMYGLLPAQLLAPGTTDGAAQSNGPNGYLQCYYDGTSNISLGNGPCDSTAYYVLGVQEAAAHAGVRIHPNPGHEVINITTDQALPAQSRLSITDLSGRCLINMANLAGKKSVSVNVHGLAKGVYLLVLNGAEGRYTRRFVVD